MSFQVCMTCSLHFHDGRPYCYECYGPLIDFPAPKELQLVQVSAASEIPKLTRKKRKK